RTGSVAVARPTFPSRPLTGRERRSRGGPSDTATAAAGAESSTAVPPASTYSQIGSGNLYETGAACASRLSTRQRLAATCGSAVREHRRDPVAGDERLDQRNEIGRA